jgi:hypothetical protein
MLVLGTVASQNTKNFLGGDFESIATFVAAGGETTINFTSIPSTYKHLQIRAIARTTKAGTSYETEYMRINADSGSNYAFHRLYGNGSTVSVGSSSSTSLIACYEIPQAGTTASSFGATIIDIHDYASTTKNKTVRAFFGYDVNGAGIVNLGSGLWMNTAAITSLQMNAAGDAMTAGTTFSLYGIKG